MLRTRGECIPEHPASWRSAGCLSGQTAHSAFLTGQWIVLDLESIAPKRSALLHRSTVFGPEATEAAGVSCALVNAPRGAQGGIGEDYGRYREVFRRRQGSASIRLGPSRFRRASRRTVSARWSGRPRSPLRDSELICRLPECTPRWGRDDRDLGDPDARLWA